MARDFTTEPNFSTEYLAALGAIVVEFSAIDAVLRNYVKRLLDVKLKIATALVAEVKYIPSLGDIIFSLAEEKFTEKATLHKLEKLLNSVAAQSETRNNLMHSFWTRDPKTNAEIRLKPSAKRGKEGKGGVKFHSETMPIQRLIELRNNMQKTRRELEEFYKKQFLKR